MSLLRLAAVGWLAGWMVLSPAFARDAGSLWREGYRAFRGQRYDRARRVFRTLLREHPDGSRARDARYFLRRLRMYGARAGRPPVVRVRLAVGRTTSGRAAASLRVRGFDDRRILRISAGSGWSARAEGASGVLLSTEERAVRGSPCLRLEPTGSGEGLRHGGIAYRGRFEVCARGGRVMLVNVLPVNEYLYGVVRKEMAPDWPMAAVKAQAVASRSFVLVRRRRARERFYHLDAGEGDQVYGGRRAETRRVIRAVEATRGEVLVYRGRLVPGFFHANSGGYIETAGEIWTGSKTPYIVAKPDTWSRATRHARWRTTLREEEISRALRAEGYPPLGSNPALRVARRLASGRSRRLSYRTPRGERQSLPTGDFRMAVGSSRLRSTWFEAIRRDGDRVRFRGRGWGHGVGMSQWGAYAMARAGLDYRRILSFYYEKARIHPWYGPLAAEVNRGE